jgi:MraZ protein
MRYTVGKSGALWVKVWKYCGAPGHSSGVPAYLRKVELMFTGRFEHSIDEKGRMTFPARFREDLGEEGGFLTLGFDQNLIVYTAANFTKISQHLNQLSLTDDNARVLRRLIFSNAVQVEYDKAGRILIPQFLRLAAGLETAAMVVAAGVYFEIWSPERWAEQEIQLNDPKLNAQRYAALNLTLE